MNYKQWSIVLFAIFILLFLMLAFFKSDVTTWIWQLVLPVLVIIQVIVVLKARDESKKEFGDDWYDKR